MNLEAYLTERRLFVDAALDRVLPPESRPPVRVHQSMRYSVLAPGKRLRPILVLAAAEAVGGRAETVLSAACALECIHAFSLIHDDLPCMDDDATRRGRPTNHMVFGEALSLLAGDALLALAFELIASTPSPPAVCVPAVIALVARAAGTRGMVGGQVADMEAEGREVLPEELQGIHARKTGALIEAAVLSGALLCGCSDLQRDSLALYGRHAGLAFQIADDILDLVGDEEQIGKPVGSDLKQAKATYPRLFGLQVSRRLAAAEVESALRALDAFGDSADPLRALAQYTIDRSS